MEGSWKGSRESSKGLLLAMFIGLLYCYQKEKRGNKKDEIPINN
jgi:hypothetical protein